MSDLAREIAGAVRAWRRSYDASTYLNAGMEEVIAAVLRRHGVTNARPKIVCLCGSTRVARDAFSEWYGKLTDEGYIVLSVGRIQPVHGWDAEHKRRLDELHLRKIDLADEVLVLNVGGYIGESTRNEIAYATQTGKPVRYLEPIEPAEPEEG